MSEPATTPRSQAEAFKALAKEARISSGAFRLWHVLYYHTDRDTGESFPGYLTIQEWTGCDTHCIPRWREELIQAGWLMFKSERATKQSHGHRYRYLLLDGHGEPFFKPKSDGGSNHTVTVKATTLAVRVKPTTRRRRNQPQSVVETNAVTNTPSLRRGDVSKDVGGSDGDPSTSPPPGAGLAPLGAPAAPPARRRINSFPDDDEPLPCDVISRGGAE